MIEKKFKYRKYKYVFQFDILSINVFVYKKIDDDLYHVPLSLLFGIERMQDMYKVWGLVAGIGINKKIKQGDKVINGIRMLLPIVSIDIPKPLFKKL